MTRGLQELRASELAEELERVTAPYLVERLRTRAAGHCMRVSDLDVDVMVRLCARLRAEVPEATVVVLSDGRAEIPSRFAVKSTKLVELRNPLADGSFRPPLLAFVPNDVRVSAEDSFGVATFEEVPVEGLYTRLRRELLGELPVGLRGAVTDSLRLVEGDPAPWRYADAVGVVRLLLTAKVNGNDAEAFGGALYELGLVPDFEWLQRPEYAPRRLAKNRECVEKLTWSPRSERGRVRELGLSDRAFRNQLGEFLTEAGAEDPRGWTRRIVLDRNLWPLAFHRWKFEGGDVEPDAIFVGDVETDLPVVKEDEPNPLLRELVGQRYLALGPGGLRRFSVKFRVDPVPSKVRGVARLVAQVVSRERGPIGLARGRKAWQTASDRATFTFASLREENWEDGWHYVRVVAQTDEGDLVPLLDEAGRTVPRNADPSLAGTRPNESDLFYVVTGEKVEVEPAQRAVPRAFSVAHALLSARFAAVAGRRDPAAVKVTRVAWVARAARGANAANEVLEVALGRDGAFNVPVCRALKALEQKILHAPRGPVSWRLPITLGRPGESTGEHTAWPEGAAAERFLSARAMWFAAVRGGVAELVTQGVLASEVQALAYEQAAAYTALVRELTAHVRSTDRERSRRAFVDLRRMLTLDAVRLAISDHRGHRREATLLGPTHPLRALWFVAWARLGEQWIEAAKSAPIEYVGPARDAILRLLTSTDFPPVLATETNQVLTAIDDVSPLWTLHVPATEADPRGLIGEVCDALGLPEPTRSGTPLDGAYLASRVQRYLVQHPYVRTLVINAFNAGRASSLADMLLTLQGDPSFAHLRYDVRLFVPDPDAPGVGEALVALLSPESAVAAQEADAFSTPAANHLHPKLRLAVRATPEFRDAPERFPSHVTLLFDFFPAEEVGVTARPQEDGAVFVHGLVQDFVTDYHEDELTVAWRRRPRHGPARPLEGAEGLAELLSALSATLSSATAVVTTGQKEGDLHPVVTLVLGAEQRMLLHQVHEVSDWVFTFDRNLGIEFFDHGGHAARPDYLIDHSPDLAHAFGHRLVITSRSVTELEALLRPVLEQYNLGAEGRHAVVMLKQLRSLSGRLALKLISAPTQRAEALGLALSRLYLEHQGVFENQVVVPLDAHLELYRPLKVKADELGDAVSFRRTDLALFDLDARRREITCRLVEVKCYAGVGDLTAYEELKAGVAEQIAQSERVIAWHFDPHAGLHDRPDRALKNRELARLLEFYLDRGVRYELFDEGAAEEVRALLHTLDDGYSLAFTRSALIFDFEKPGTEPPTLEGGIEYHRVGHNLIRQLVDAAAYDVGASTEDQTSGLGGLKRGVERVRQQRGRAPSVPTLEQAAFLGERRERMVAHAAPVSTSEAATTEHGPRSQDSVVAQTLSEAEGRPSPEPPANASVEADQEAAGASRYDVLLGATRSSPQYGLIGEVSGRRVAIDLNETHTISLFGVQGGGKSYTLGALAEMATVAIPRINVLNEPLVTVIFHYSSTMDYSPEFTSMVAPNRNEAQVRALREQYGIEPRGIDDVVLLVPADKLAERSAEHPGIAVHPLKFGPRDLQAAHWKVLMGAVGNQALYLAQLNRLMKASRHELSVSLLRERLANVSMPDNLKERVEQRLELAAAYVDDHASLKALVRPGRLLIVDLRDEFIAKDEAFGLFFVLLQVIAGVNGAGGPSNKLFVFDEAHKYMEDPALVDELIRFVREMRHGAFSVLVASQDPLSLPQKVIELSDVLFVHRFNSPAWLKHLQKANTALASLTPERMVELRPGEAFVWASRATDEAFSKGAVKVVCRPRVTQHGGVTRTAVRER